MKKFISMLMTISLCLLTISGCNYLSTGSATSKATTELELGTYKSIDENNSQVTATSLQINADESFTLTLNLFESNIILGKYKVNQNILTLNTENGDIYLFEIKDQDLIFQKESSSDISIDDKLVLHLKTK